jgi:hypothetical protein
MNNDTYPDTPGHRGVDTSIEAANDIAPDLGRYQRSALSFIRAAGDAGLTAEELAGAMGVDRTTAQPRTSELRLRYMIKDSGQRRRNASGKRAIVWVALSEAERAELQSRQNVANENAPDHGGANDA